MGIQSLTPSGGIKSIQRVTVTMANAVASTTGTINAVDITKSIIMPAGSTSTSDYSQDSNFEFKLTNSTTITITRGNSRNSATASCQVIEYV